MIVKEKMILTEKNQEYSRSIKTIDNLCFNMCVCVFYLHWEYNNWAPDLFDPALTAL